MRDVRLDHSTPRTVMRRLWLKFLLWCEGYCTKHMRRKVFHPRVTSWLHCPICRQDDYERWLIRLRLMKEEYQELDANR